MWVCVLDCGCLQRPEVLESTGTWITGPCEPSDVSAGEWTRVYHNSSVQCNWTISPQVLFITNYCCYYYFYYFVCFTLVDVRGQLSGIFWLPFCRFQRSDLGYTHSMHTFAHEVPCSWIAQCLMCARRFLREQRFISLVGIHIIRIF